ncbi:hypothetical protein CC2G_010067 [Coprinopsis cinerea AmutBmut pab1-1]|nr:hypothetical protein CC2G_010067 [Coprinopsis cinerea AmutBmut pab1-1]
MLAHSMDTPNRKRPRPPAKMRRRSSLAALNSSTASSRTLTSSPPPAYASTPSDELVVPTDSHSFPETLLGSPVPSSFRFKPLDPMSPGPGTGSGSGGPQEWIDEKSREELAELLVKAEDIIKERENELGMTAAVVKGLYETNIALKSKHEAFLSRLPVSSSPRATPPPASSSPDDDLHLIVSRNNSYSSTDSVNYDSSPVAPVPPPFYRRHARHVSMSTNEISLLADQNAELMQKIEQLESESNSADQAGRRELKRLEKEIASLREALEKTQAKSQELEEKTKGLDKGIDRVVEDAWKKKRERELRIQALKSAGREETPGKARDFAPRGSTFGYHAFSRSMSNLAEFEDDDIDQDGVDEDETLTNDKAPLFVPPEHEIITQLLRKVQELEETNSKILQQQKETVNQLQAVQRDAEQMSKMYEGLGDPQDLDVDVEDVDADSCVKFGSSPRKAGSFNSRKRSKERKSLAGLFEDQPSSSSSVHPLYASWNGNDGRHRSSYSLDSNTGLASPALSTLSFLNSPHMELDELSPAGPRRTLDAELGKYLKGEEYWSGSYRGFNHLRTHSLSNLSQWSAPASPSPNAGLGLPNVASLAIPNPPSSSSLGNNVPLVVEPKPSPLPTPPNQGLHLSVDPPTPEKEKRVRPSPSGSSLRAQDNQQLHPGSKSPRQQFISQRIRDRRARWEDERFGSLSSISSSVWGEASGSKPEPVFVAPSPGPPAVLRGQPGAKPKMPRRITSIVDSLVDQFDGAAAGGVVRNRSRTRFATPDTESGYEESDEGDYDEYTDEGAFGDSSFETTEYDEDDDEDGYEDDDDTEGDEPHLKTPQLAEGNALQLHQTRSPTSVSFANPTASPSSGNKKKAPGSKWGNVLLELWLWLQFAVIIFVFLFAMAKRGPKAVLADAEGRGGRTRKVSLHARRH